jgi:hypothetical protein
MPATLVGGIVSQRRRPSVLRPLATFGTASYALSHVHLSAADR